MENTLWSMMKKKTAIITKNGRCCQPSERQERTASGYRRTVTIYQSKGCGCLLKNVLGNHYQTALEERIIIRKKVLYIEK